MSQFKHDDFQFGLEIALGACQYGAADAGEVLVTAERIRDGDADAWVREWTATADAVEAAGREAAAAGRRVSALAYLRRAATYLATALDQIDASHEHDAKRALWGAPARVLGADRGSHRAASGMAIPYEDTAMPGFFFRAPDAAPSVRRGRSSCLNNGSDGATSQMWVQGGAAASERGYHWMTFDGPGQQALLFEHGVPFRPDWEAVVRPWSTRWWRARTSMPTGSPSSGISQGGFWVPRALAFEHRFAAAVADPGVVDVSASWLEPLPEEPAQGARGGQAGAVRPQHADRRALRPVRNRAAHVPRRALRAARRLALPALRDRHGAIGSATRWRTSTRRCSSPIRRASSSGRVSPSSSSTACPARRSCSAPPPRKVPGATASRWRRHSGTPRVFDWLDGYLAGC